MNRGLLLASFSVGLSFWLSGCHTPVDSMATHFKDPHPELGENRYLVKTTAYCHHEADSQPYGRKTARGTYLRGEGELRSAAADWSRYPVGTQFRIIGHPQVYEVDDYGSALVGTDTIDIYQPSLSKMRSWGAPVLGIEILHWGSFEESARILEGRVHKAEHIGAMLDSIRERMKTMPEELKTGYAVDGERHRA